ncbi:heat shock protein Hsp18 [Haloimpatiens sp. FM7330]|uniref:heat shock protein Hsp18 n=1 Tax=Haloimpatiens sp. FM7330 TaxID=3298610 RepID=UPI003637A89F
MFNLVPFSKNNNVMNEGDYFNNFIDSFFDHDFFTPMKFVSNTFRVDVKETDDNYILEAALPGINRDSISIDYNNNYLTIVAKKNDTIEDKDEHFVRREIHYGQFKRTFYMDNIDETKIYAAFNNGVLKITLPKLEKDQNKIKKIEIH